MSLSVYVFVSKSKSTEDFVPLGNEGSPGQLPVHTGMCICVCVRNGLYQQRERGCGLKGLYVCVPATEETGIWDPGAATG